MRTQMQLGRSTEAAISHRRSSTSSHRRCYSLNATSPLFAAHLPLFWPNFCVCFLANPCSALFGQPLFELLSPLFSRLRRVFEPLFSFYFVAFQPPFHHCLPPFSHLCRDLKLLPFPVLFEFQNCSILG
ncbi:uncharacterized protein DS421_15g507190 [Arachis hypogaea]|nr:uncharacterized protein DS421_15g507190 [Arachis hypogaea]